MSFLKSSAYSRSFRDPTVVLKKFGVFQVLQGPDRGDIRHMVAGNDQHPKVRQAVKEIQAGDIVVTDIERQQVPAVLQDFKVRAAVLEAGVVVERGPGGIIGPDQVLMVGAFDDQRPSPLDIREAGGQQVTVLPVHFGLPHIDPAQVRHLLQETEQSVKIPDHQVPQVDVFRVFRIAFPLVGDICRHDRREKQQDHEAAP